MIEFNCSNNIWIFKYKFCPCGETDITTDFGSVVPGSNPGRGIFKNVNNLWIMCITDTLTDIVRWDVR